MIQLIKIQCRPWSLQCHSGVHGEVVTYEEFDGLCVHNDLSYTKTTKAKVLACVAN